MAGRKGSKAMNQGCFDEIKKLLEANVPAKYVQEITKRSSYTVRLVSKSETYEDYQQYNQARFAAIRHKEKTITNMEPTPNETADRLTNIENMLSRLLNIFEEKEARANVAFWKR